MGRPNLPPLKFPFLVKHLLSILERTILSGKPSHSLRKVMHPNLQFPISAKIFGFVWKSAVFCGFLCSPSSWISRRTPRRGPEPQPFRCITRAKFSEQLCKHQLLKSSGGINLMAKLSDVCASPVSFFATTSYAFSSVTSFGVPLISPSTPLRWDKDWMAFLRAVLSSKSTLRFTWLTSTLNVRSKGFVFGWEARSQVEEVKLS